MASVRKFLFLNLISVALFLPMLIQMGDTFSIHQSTSLCQNFVPKTPTYPRTLYSRLGWRLGQGYPRLKIKHTSKSFVTSCSYSSTPFSSCLPTLPSTSVTLKECTSLSKYTRGSWGAGGSRALKLEELDDNHIVSLWLTFLICRM